jgi:hypothetical protein
MTYESRLAAARLKTPKLPGTSDEPPLNLGNSAQNTIGLRDQGVLQPQS